MLSANFPVSSFSFISPRVSVMMLKSLKLWVILHFDVGFIFILFFIGRKRQKLDKEVTLGRGHSQGIKLAPPSPGGSLTQGPSTGRCRSQEKVSS